MQTLQFGANKQALCCNGNVTLLFEGTNVVKGNPAVFSAEGKTLIIDGNGSLTATSEDTEEVESCSAAIGSPYYGTCGNIIIKGGYIKATSESGSAGIGCGYFGNCGDITITVACILPSMTMENDGR